MYTISLLVLIILGFIALAIGGIFGILIGSFSRSAPKKKRELASAPRPIPAGLTSIAHLWRKKGDNSLVVELELEGLIGTASDLNDAQKIKLAQTAQDLQRWLGLPQLEPAAKSNLPTVGSAAAPVANEPVQVDLKPVPASLVSLVKTGQAKPKPAPTSIAAQINDILQEMLINTPLEKRAIRLFEIPEKGMVVLVGLDQYDTVDEVPDEIIRKVIKLAVQKWEKRIEKESKPH